MDGFTEVLVCTYSLNLNTLCWVQSLLDMKSSYRIFFGLITRLGFIDKTKNISETISEDQSKSRNLCTFSTPSNLFNKVERLGVEGTGTLLSINMNGLHERFNLFLRTIITYIFDHVPVDHVYHSPLIIHQPFQ